MLCKKAKNFWLTEMNSHGSKIKISVSCSISVSEPFFIHVCVWLARVR